ncbi:hypothetical protein MMC17_000753 [Xylographa soralifera]|nr:hypothetical protein [Xylographa soralifera]
MPFQVFLDKIDATEYRKDHVINTCQLFLRLGADPNTVSKGVPLLHKSFFIIQFDISDHALRLAKRLCETADVNKLTDDGKSPLHIVARSYNLQTQSDLTDILLRRGASPDQLDKSGSSPLILVLKARVNVNTVTGMITSLVQARANPMQRDRDGDLPVYHAYRSDKHSKRWCEVVTVLVDSYSAGDMPIERSTVYPNDHMWWNEYRRLRREKICFGGKDLRRLAEFAKYLPDDIEANVSRFLMIELVHKMLEDAKRRFLTHKVAFGLGTVEGGEFQDVVVAVLRECEQMKLDIDQKWYHFTLEFFD